MLARYRAIVVLLCASSLARHRGATSAYVDAYDNSTPTVLPLAQQLRGPRAPISFTTLRPNASFAHSPYGMCSKNARRSVSDQHWRCAAAGFCSELQRDLYTTQV